MALELRCFLYSHTLLVTDLAVTMPVRSLLAGSAMLDATVLEVSLYSFIFPTRTDLNLKFYLRGFAPAHYPLYSTLDPSLWL